jgi:uncharacterized protein YeaC (DUF1315 family)
MSEMDRLARFRQALVPHLGRHLTPELCAALEHAAFARIPLAVPLDQKSGRLQIDGEQRQEYLDFLNAAFGTGHRLDAVRLLTVLRGQCIAAVVMYSRMSRRSCEMTIATDGQRDWATRSTLAAIFNYPFQHLRLHRVTVVVRADNAPSLTLCERLGWQREGCVREAFEDGCHGIVMGMLRPECRWIGDNQ